jgi:hypothetical protein
MGASWFLREDFRFPRTHRRSKQVTLGVTGASAKAENEAGSDEEQAETDMSADSNCSGGASDGKRSGCDKCVREVHFKSESIDTVR